MRLSTAALPMMLWASLAQAQTMRPFETFRQSHGDTRLGARVEYAAGNLKLMPGQPDELYRMELSYDEDRYVPVSDFNNQTGAVCWGSSRQARVACG